MCLEQLWKEGELRGGWHQSFTDSSEALKWIRTLIPTPLKFKFKPVLLWEWQRQTFRHTTWAPMMPTCRDFRASSFLPTMPRPKLTAFLRLSVVWIILLYSAMSPLSSWVDTRGGAGLFLFSVWVWAPACAGQKWLLVSSSTASHLNVWARVSHRTWLSRKRLARE